MKNYNLPDDEAPWFSKCALAVWRRLPPKKPGDDVLPPKRKIFAPLLKGNITASDMFGNTYRLSLQSYIDMLIYTKGHFEGPLIEFFKKLIEKNKIDTFIDVGANIGIYSISIANLESVKRVLAFEPDPDVSKYLNRNVELNSLENKIQWINGAVSDKSGNASFYIQRCGWIENRGVSSLINNVLTGNNVKEPRKIGVQTISLNEVLGVRNKKIAIKIDVEGGEMDVINGMNLVSENNSIILQVEIWPENFDEINDRLSKIGFFQIKSPYGVHEFFYCNDKALSV